MLKMPRRGLFVVFEGCDRCGKSTQSKLLTEFLQHQQVKVKHLRFPARDSEIGKVIDAYLCNKKELSDQAIHLLFSANRWESMNSMRKLLKSGVTLVVDRYSYSGVAYSAAKGLPYEWCMFPEKGLIRPDIVFYLKTSVEDLVTRGSFGEERYEKIAFQKNVSKQFDRIHESERNYWHKLNAAYPKADLHEEISRIALNKLQELDDTSLGVLQ